MMDFSNILTPAEYHEAAYLSRLTAKEMLTRLNVMTLQPSHVLDLGCGVGEDLEALSLRFPGAQIQGIDVAESFLFYSKKRLSQKRNLMMADAATLPFASHAVDLIFANMLLPWCANPKELLREWRRVLRPDGLLFFSCLGPDTFKEWQGVENLHFRPSLVDMHIVGDALVEEGFVDPVLEVDEFTFTYLDQEKMQKEMKGSGLIAETTAVAPLAATIEVIYAHAFCPAVKGFKPDERGEVRIPVSQLR